MLKNKKKFQISIIIMRMIFFHLKITLKDQLNRYQGKWKSKVKVFVTHIRQIIILQRASLKHLILIKSNKILFLEI